MALFYECMLKCARKVLDTADIVRDAMFRHLLPYSCIELAILDKDTLVLLARKFARIEAQETTMTAAGHLGLHLRVKRTACEAFVLHSCEK